MARRAVLQPRVREDDEIAFVSDPAVKTRRIDAAAISSLVVLAAATGAFLFHTGRRLVFFFDEWDFVQGRRTGGLSTFLRAHNGHLVAVPVALYRIGFATVGLRHYGAYRAMIIAFHLLCVILLFAYARRRAAATSPALLVAAALLLLGIAWEDLLWPFQVTYLAGLAAGLGALLVVTASTRWRAVALAGGLVVVALASSGIGIPVALGIAAAVCAQRSWRHVVAVVVPVMIYGAWYVADGHSDASIANARQAINYVFHIGAGTGGSIVGRGEAVGVAIGLVIAAAIAVRIGRDRAVPPGVAFGIVGAGTFWGLTALARAQFHDPHASRYVYPGALFLLVAVADLLRPLRRQAWVASLAILVAVALGLPAQVRALHAGSNGLHGTAATVKPELLALELAAGRADSAFRPDLQRMPQVFTGTYLAAVHALGSPTFGMRAVAGLSRDQRAAIDATLVRALHLEVTDRPGPAPRCRPVAHDGHADVTLLPGETVITSGAGTDVALYRFGRPRSAVPAGHVDAGGAATIVVVTDRSPAPWHLVITGASSGVCGPGEGSR